MNLPAWDGVISSSSSSLSSLSPSLPNTSSRRAAAPSEPDDSESESERLPDSRERLPGSGSRGLANRSSPFPEGAGGAEAQGLDFGSPEGAGRVARWELLDCAR